MSKKSEFINFIESQIDDWSEASEEAQAYWEAFRGKEEVDKPLFTDNGKLILNYMKIKPKTLNIDCNHFWIQK